jgi:hypothetical protein
VIAFVTALSLLACSDDGGDLDAYCATAGRFTADNPAAAFSRIDPADPTGTSAALEAAAEALAAWSDEAPGEVREDVEVLADAAATLAVAFEPGDDGTVEDDPSAAVDTGAVEEASARVLAFTIERCEVDLDPATTLPAATSPPDD